MDEIVAYCCSGWLNLDQVRELLAKGERKTYFPQGAMPSVDDRKEGRKPPTS
jgi:hypothetical protein